MVEMNRSRARVVWAGECADHPLTQIRRLEALVIDVMFEAFDHRPLEQHFPSLVIAGETALELVAGWSFADPQIAVAVGTQGVSQACFHAAERLPALAIRRSEPADFLLAQVIVFPELDAAAVVERNKHARAGG